MYYRLIDGFIIKVFWKDSNLDYKRGKSEAYSIGILNVIWGVIFGMKKIKLELVMIFESYIGIYCLSCVYWNSANINSETYTWELWVQNWVDFYLTIDDIMFWDEYTSTK